MWQGDELHSSISNPDTGSRTRRAADIKQPFDKCREEAGHVLAHAPEILTEPVC